MVLSLYQWGGYNQLVTKVNTLETELNNLKNQIGTSSKFGLVKTSDSSSVTNKDSGLVLSATEKNASVDGTLGHLINNNYVAVTTINNNLNKWISSNRGYENDPNVTTRILSLFNGWNADAKNYPSEFKNSVALLITIWAVGFASGSLNDERSQAMLGYDSSGKTLLKIRLFDANKVWSNWI